MRKPVIILSGLALAALAAGGGIAYAEQSENASPEPAATATPVPGTGTAAPDADDEAQDDAEDAAENKTEDAAEDDVTSKPAVLAEQAQKTALSQVSGGWIVSSELEAENGAPAWEISVADGSGAEREIVVDAASGKIIPTPAGEQENEAQDD
ncbi:PepSY domain-containing protein [Planobispora longispora]|uniref:PepSY domain-containing protein n=1 Tax=Planobispora longispora TaxID=28887 RepID=A0A8J3RIT1_9ACTN|nr:PepSY domain-containing protein [Planobispora longispora]GIH75689.1 hypothetical protein Plo01_21180 [Planobispora longispora]